MEPSEETEDISIKGGNMCFNRFCIDEDARFQLSGVRYLKKSSMNITHAHMAFLAERRSKGNGFLSLQL